MLNMEFKRSRTTAPLIASPHAPTARRTTPHQFAIDSQLQGCQQQSQQ
jgi:hypothetical protein